MRFLVVLAVALTAVNTSAAAAPDPVRTKLERRVTLESEIVSEMNRHRGARSRRPLRASPGLRTAARSHSRAMLEFGFFGHDSADGTAFVDRIRRYYTDRGWETWSVGEALLASDGGQVTATAIVKAWMSSPSHRRLILSSAWRDTGIGIWYTEIAPQEYGGAEAVVVTADFGLRDGKATRS